MDAKNRYTEAVSQALAGFQIIEAELKDYISEYHLLIKEFLPKQIKYEYGRKDIEDSALGRLVSMFDRMNANSSLIDSLRKLQPKRDELAHRALVKIYGVEKDNFEFEDHINELIDLANDLACLIEDLLKERVKLYNFKKLKLEMPSAIN